MSDSLQSQEQQHARPPIHHQLPEFTQTRVHWVGDAIQPSYPLLSPSPPAFNLFQHQGLFQWVGSSHQVAKILELQLQHQSFQWIFSLFPLGLTGLISLQSKGLSRVFSSTTVQKHQFFGARPSLWSNSHISTSVGTKKFPLHQGVPDSPLPHIVWPRTQQNADNREKPSGLLQFPKTCYWSQKTWDICLFLKII